MKKNRQLLHSYPALSFGYLRNDILAWPKSHISSTNKLIWIHIPLKNAICSHSFLNAGIWESDCICSTVKIGQKEGIEGALREQSEVNPSLPPLCPLYALSLLSLFTLIKDWMSWVEVFAEMRCHFVYFSSIRNVQLIFSLMKEAGRNL